MGKKKEGMWYDVFCVGKGAKARLPLWQNLISSTDSAEQAEHVRGIAVKAILKEYEAEEKADFYTVFILPALKEGRWVAKKDGSPISPQGLFKRIKDWEKDDNPDSQARLKAIPLWARESVKYLLSLERGINRARANRRAAEQERQEQEKQEQKKQEQQTVSIIARNVYSLQQQSTLLKRIHDLLVDGLNKQHSAQKVLDAMLTAISSKQAECEAQIASLLCKTEGEKDGDKLVMTI